MDGIPTIMVRGSRCALSWCMMLVCDGVCTACALQVFRKDDSGRSFHETYHGERSVEKITIWAENFVAQQNKEIAKTRNVDVDNDG